MKKLSDKQKELLNRTAKVMEYRPEAGPVVAIYGSGETRSALALQKMGLVDIFTLCPYDETFIRIKAQG